MSLYVILVWTGSGYKLESKHPHSKRGALESIERLRAENPTTKYELAEVTPL